MHVCEDRIQLYIIFDAYCLKTRLEKRTYSVILFVKISRVAAHFLHELRNSIFFNFTKNGMEVIWHQRKRQYLNQWDTVHFKFFFKTLNQQLSRVGPYLGLPADIIQSLYLGSCQRAACPVRSRERLRARSPSNGVNRRGRSPQLNGFASNGVNR